MPHHGFCCIVPVPGSSSNDDAPLCTDCPTSTTLSANCPSSIATHVLLNGTNYDRTLSRTGSNNYYDGFSFSDGSDYNYFVFVEPKCDGGVFTGWRLTVVSTQTGSHYAQFDINVKTCCAPLSSTAWVLVFDNIGVTAVGTS